jgi:hypothetical protein
VMMISIAATIIGLIIYLPKIFWFENPNSFNSKFVFLRPESTIEWQRR